jgi:hypothetical protein
MLAFWTRSANVTVFEAAKDHLRLLAYGSTTSSAKYLLVITRCDGVRTDPFHDKSSPADKAVPRCARHQWYVFYSHPVSTYGSSCLPPAGIHCPTTMIPKDELDVDAAARAGLQKLGYKQEMKRVCACACSVRVSCSWSSLVSRTSTYIVQ